MLSTETLLRLNRLGLLPKNAVAWRVKDGRFEYRHATRGWRGRSLKTLRSLGAL